MAGDGSRYISASGQGRVNFLPYTMAEGRNRSLAEAYGGRDGLAAHPPGAANIPHRPASSAPGAGYYVEVADPCHEAGPAEACAFLREQENALVARTRSASPDLKIELAREQARLRDQLRGCR